MLVRNSLRVFGGAVIASAMLLSTAAVADGYSTVTAERLLAHVSRQL